MEMPIFLTLVCHYAAISDGLSGNYKLYSAKRFVRKPVIRITFSLAVSPKMGAQRHFVR